MKFKNISSSGDLDVRVLNVLVPAGGVIDVSAEHAASFTEQPDVWKKMPANTKTTTEEKR